MAADVLFTDPTRDELVKAFRKAARSATHAGAGRVPAAASSWQRFAARVVRTPEGCHGWPRPDPNDWLPRLAVFWSTDDPQDRHL